MLSSSSSVHAVGKQLSEIHGYSHRPRTLRSHTRDTIPVIFSSDYAIERGCRKANDSGGTHFAENLRAS
jgi:hypothetical protein